METVDVTILGGGCSGLSLAVALAEAGPADRRIRVVEPRTTYARDRTWCFWNAVPHPFEDAIRNRWRQWAVRHGGSTVRRSAAATEYVEIPADRFYAACRDRLDARENVELALGARASVIQPTDAGHRIETTAGAFRSRLVFDGRAPRSRAVGDPIDVADPRLWQHFMGRHVRTSRAVFDPDTVTLMDFDVDASRGLHFLYVLPCSATEALVESTYFSPRPLDPGIYERDIAAYLETRFGITEADTQIVGEESGCLPMFESTPKRAAPGVVPIGIAGGACRPSTGYAFLTIQRQAQRIARALARDPALSADALAPLAAIDRGPVLRQMDGMLLSFLARRPEEAPILFHSLFERADPNALARFLMDAPRPTDLVEVVRSMPALRFLRGVVTAGPARSRAAASRRRARPARGRPP
ncbi:MAG: lycopene cyclase family protein, partial [Myxococcota bacterium]